MLGYGEVQSASKGIPTTAAATTTKSFQEDCGNQGDGGAGNSNVPSAEIENSRQQAVSVPNNNSKPDPCSSATTHVTGGEAKINVNSVSSHGTAPTNFKSQYVPAAQCDTSGPSGAICNSTSSSVGADLKQYSQPGSGDAPPRFVSQKTDGGNDKFNGVVCSSNGAAVAKVGDAKELGPSAEMISAEMTGSFCHNEIAASKPFPHGDDELMCSRFSTSSDASKATAAPSSKSSISSKSSVCSKSSVTGGSDFGV